LAKESRKLKRGPVRGDGKAKKKALQQPMVQQRAEMPDPFGREQLKSMGVRLGLPLLGVWVVGTLIAALNLGQTTTIIALGLPTLITLFLIGLLIWALVYARKAKGVQNILSRIESAEDRRAALDKLDSTYKKKDVTAVMAKAQLLMQEDPHQALAVMEEINLNKVMNTVADEVRAQRAMIHLMMGEVTEARSLADGIDMSRHQDPKTRAMLGAVVGEAWSRSGQAKKALETLEIFDPEDDELAPIKPQLYRALAYAHAHTTNVKGVRRDLKKLLDQDVRLLGGFMMKKTHPLLQKEARKLVERSGQVKPKMQVQRR
jgi:hypothetical protein